MAETQETNVGSVIDSITTYVIALFTLLFATILVHASTIMTVGGLVLLALRLYVDGKRAWRTWKTRKDADHDD